MNLLFEVLYVHLVIPILIHVSVVSEVKGLHYGHNLIPPDGLSDEGVVAVWFELPQHLLPWQGVVPAVEEGCLCAPTNYLSV